MKKLLILIFVFAFSKSFGQLPSDSNKYIHYPFTPGIWYPKIIVDKVFTPPQDTIYSKYGIAMKGGTMYYGNGVLWTAISGGGGGGGSYSAGNGLTLSGSTFKADTSIVSTKNNVLYYYDLLNAGKVNVSDTAGMLTNYKHWLAGYLKLSDTGTIATKNYALSLFDILNANKVAKTLTLTINGTAQDLTANRTWNVGTVTSVAAGTGLSGGTITGSGTINADTTKLQTRDDNKRRLDSIYYATLSLKTGTGNFKDSVANVLDPSYGGGNGSALRLQGAIASGKSVFIPYGTQMNIHDTSIVLNDYQKLFGGGEIYSSNVGTFGSYAGMFSMVKTGKYNTIDGITFRGAGKGTFITSDYYTQQNGIQILDSANLITNCIFFGIKGAGVLGMEYTGSWQNNDNNIINNCRFESNTVGVYNFYGGNYQVITGCTMINNYIGVAQQTANAKIVSTTMAYNHIGFIGEGGPADRGQITGCSINHSDTAMILKNTSFGYLITGTTFFWGDIYLKDADKTTFSNCLIGTNAGVKIDGSGIVNKNVQFISCVDVNTNTWTEAGTGKIIRAGYMYDNSTRFEITKTTKLADSLLLTGIASNQIDTTNYKPLVVDANGNVKKSFTPTYGGGGSYTAGNGLTLASTTFKIDSAVTATLPHLYKTVDSMKAVTSAQIHDSLAANTLDISTNFGVGDTIAGFLSANKLVIKDIKLGSGLMKDVSATNDTVYAIKHDSTVIETKLNSQHRIDSLAATKQATLVSGTNIKTINGSSILGSGNISISGSGGGYTSTPTAAGTTTLTSSSTQYQNFTGTTTQTVVLPDATTLTAGTSFYIANNSTGNVTVNLNGGTLLKTMAGGTTLSVLVTDISTSAGTWNVEYSNDGTMIQDADATDADFTALANSVKLIPASTLTANRTITIPTGANGNVIEIYNNEPTFTLNLTGATVYMLDRTTTVSALLPNVPAILKKISGKWVITN